MNIYILHTGCKSRATLIKQSDCKECKTEEPAQLDAKYKCNMFGYRCKMIK